MCISLLGGPPVTVGGLIPISEDSGPAMFTPTGIMHGIWHPNNQIEEAQESGQILDTYIHHSAIQSFKFQGGGLTYGSGGRGVGTRSGAHCTKPDCDQQKHRA